MKLMTKEKTLKDDCSYHRPGTETPLSMLLESMAWSMGGIKEEEGQQRVRVLLQLGDRESNAIAEDLAFLGGGEDREGNFRGR